MLTGNVIGESLRAGAELRVDGLRLARISRLGVPNEPAGMPAIWTIIEYEAADDRADELARQLADVLVADGGWYADFGVGTDHVVVFAGKVFRYRKGDKMARAEVHQYGLSVGCPADQLDWKD